MDSAYSRFLTLACVLIAAGCTTNGPPPPANFAINAHARPEPNNLLQILVDGVAFTPGGRARITYTSVPNRGGVQPGGPDAFVQGDGTFKYTETAACTTSDPADVGTVLVAATDIATGLIAFKNVPGNPWLCRQ